MATIERWLVERLTPLLWVSGPAGCGKTIAVESEVRRASAQAGLLRLSAFQPDDALTEAGTRANRQRLTAKLLLQFAADRGLVVIDALDALQQTVGHRTGDIIDCRFRQLLLAACQQALPGVNIIVTSRLDPPAWLPEDSFTITNLIEATDVGPLLLPPSGSLELRVLEFAALSRRAFDSAAIQRISGIDEPSIGPVLNDLASLSLVTRVNHVSYQAPDWVRALVLSDATRAGSIRAVAIENLQQNKSDPERLFHLLIDKADFDEALNVYWYSLGNFKRLHREGRDHFGAQLCRLLNEGLGPDEVSPILRDLDGCWAVMNDWSQFAVCCGDARASTLAATSAYELLPNDRPRWDAAVLAAHAAQAYVMSGNLRTAMHWCETGWNNARDGLRQKEGFAVREVMDAYDWSASAMARIYLRHSNSAELQRLIDDLVSIHDYARRSIAEFNAASIIPIGGPSGEVKLEQLVGGRLAAILALVEGRFADLRSFALVDAETLAGRELLTLLLRAEISAGSAEEADTLSVSLRDSAEQRDDCAAECELAVLMEAKLENSSERLALAASYLPRAEACGLGLHWTDLQLVRSYALMELGRREEAGNAAEAALYGTSTIDGANLGSDWTTARKAVTVLQDLGRTVPDHVLERLQQDAPPPRQSPRKPETRRPSASSARGKAARLDIHAAATRALEAYDNEGMPFALYFRKYGVDVLHGPSEFGPKLTENALRDALPSEVEVIALQEHNTIAYDFSSSRMRREAPALLLNIDQWAEIVKGLIPHADLIVSEPLMLGEGVRTELQMIYEAGRWDRTVLVLPPLHSPFELIDSDPLIQMFPRCIWADSLHREYFSDSPMVADLLDRIRQLARVPIETRRTLRESTARDQAFPIDLLPIAEHLESQATTASILDQFNNSDESTRYYAFWQMFRASTIRGIRYNQGDKSDYNRSKLAQSYLEMSKIMLDHSTEDDRFILQGDPADAKLLVQSAYGLIGDASDDPVARILRGQAEDQWENLLKLEEVVRQNQHRFEIRPRYGPLVLGNGEEPSA